MLYSMQKSFIMTKNIDFSLPDTTQFNFCEKEYALFLSCKKSAQSRNYYSVMLQMANTAFADAWWSFFTDSSGKIKHQKIDKVSEKLNCDFSNRYLTKDANGKYKYIQYLYGSSALDFLANDAIEAIIKINTLEETRTLILEHWQYIRVLPIQSWGDTITMLESAQKMRDYMNHSEDKQAPNITDFIQSLYFVAIFCPPMISKIFFDRIRIANTDKIKANYKKYIPNTIRITSLDELHKHFATVHKTNMHDFHANKMSKSHHRKSHKNTKHSENEANRKARSKTKDFKHIKQNLQKKYTVYVNEEAGLSLWKFVKYYNFIGKKNISSILKKMGLTNGTNDIERKNNYSNENLSFTLEIIEAYRLNLHIGFILYDVYTDIYNAVKSHLPHDEAGHTIYETKQKGQKKDSLKDICKHKNIPDTIKGKLNEETINILNIARNNVQHNRLFDSIPDKKITLYDIFSTYIDVCKSLKLHKAREKIIHQIYNICKKQDHATCKDTKRTLKQDEKGFYYYDTTDNKKRRNNVNNVDKKEVHTRPYIRTYATYYNKALIKAVQKNKLHISRKKVLKK